ncbi:response regulator [Alteriqipengyuania flavescens]|uniref:response regulator n=1 Tax=Alteriqipengyuania flavescens TaxID=3053610 RepID=UPI0025B5195A|nr:response regulator [Alteriqipengyuania flavescens]WJY19883.1 response regulator [Alteriqipengyuania flavescens]WJY25825.1 response regulator [Alteriqipengyuania flavescens]
MRVAIVEDEILVAAHLEAMLEDLGYEPVGIAVDANQAKGLIEKQPDIALVDLNLRDGPTGQDIGHSFGSVGTAVIFLTGNPHDIVPPIPGAVGKMAKPCDDSCVERVLGYVKALRSGEAGGGPPSALMPL